MKKVNETDSLNQLIALYEQKHESELKALKEQFHVAYESLKPFNLIKSVFHGITDSAEIKNDLASNAIGLGAGFLSKKLFGNYGNSPVKRIVGTAAQFALAHLVAKHSETIKAIGGNLFSYFSNKTKK